jgi:excinuclease ABC subunit C
MAENSWVAVAFQFAEEAAFPGEDAAAVVRRVPALPGVFALYGEAGRDGVAAQPYISRAADLRRRVGRLLAPPELGADGTPVASKRLNLRDRVRRIAWTVTGSEFESVLVLYRAAAAVYGIEEARRRLRLHTPYCVRFAAENAFPRLYVTNRLSRRGLATTCGPFPSRAAAERYADAVLDLFKLRRCWEELAPAAEHPGCVYGEMKKCLRPCQRAQEAEGAAEYAAEAAAVRQFLDTRGESMAVAIGLEREEASAAMEFERAAELHGLWAKVRAVQALADELVQPLPEVRALIVQRAARQLPAAHEGDAQGPPDPEAEGESNAVVRSSAGAGTGGDGGLNAAVFLVKAGCVIGPEMLSTLGVRAVREQTAVGSSLFAQPLMLGAVPLADPGQPAAPATAAESPEARSAGVIARLEQQAMGIAEVGAMSDYLAMVRRWYFRPEKQRVGEVFLPDANGGWPVRRILNGAARVALGSPGRLPDAQRELAERNPADAAQRPGKTKVLHEGRPDVERVVPVVEKAARFRSRRKAGVEQPSGADPQAGSNTAE